MWRSHSHVLRGDHLVVAQKRREAVAVVRCSELLRLDARDAAKHLVGSGGGGDGRAVRADAAVTGRRESRLHVVGRDGRATAHGNR